MPHFGENSDIWPRYWQSKLKSRFLGTSFSRLTFLKSGGDPVYPLSNQELVIQACIGRYFSADIDLSLVWSGTARYVIA